MMIIAVMRNFVHRIPQVHRTRATHRAFGIGVVVLAVMPGALAPGAGKGAAASSETIAVEIVLRTGGRLTGEVLDHSEHGVVILSNDKPFVFSWSELDPGSAYATRRRLLVVARGDEASLSAEDHFQLGLVARHHGRNDLASNEFRSAIRMDENYQPRIRGVLQSDEPRQSGGPEASAWTTLPNSGNAPEHEPSRGLKPAARTADAAWRAGSTRRTDEPTAGPNHRLPADRRLQPSPRMTGTPDLMPPLSAAGYEQMMAVYKQFGEEVQAVLGKDIVLVESDHFLIWTDWESLHRDRMVQWCEAMYDALCAQFSLSPTDQVFLAKCPVFSWQSKARFRKFAQLFDGYAGSDATGYTRSIARNGHVHVVLLRQGRSAADFDRFAHTLVHEGTHAFLHRLYTPRLIPHWINEGYAELVAERVLGDRCPSGEKAQLLAKQYARFAWPVADFLASTEPLEVHQYPLAHSLVSYLEGLGPDRFVGLIKDLKNGSTFSDALPSRYDGMTVDRFERQWREVCGETDPD